MSSESSEVTPNFEYQVALSFAGEERDYVQVVAEGLTRLGITHFLDSENEEDLWGKNLPEYFDWVFSRGSEYVVVFVSEHYAAKSWTRLELRSAVARALLEKNEYILPVRFDQAHLDGIPDTTCYIDLEGKTPERLAAMIANKVRRRGFVVQAPAVNRDEGTSDNVDDLARTVLKYMADPSQEVALTGALIGEAQKVVNRIPLLTNALVITSKEDTDHFVKSIADLVGPLANALAKLSYFGDVTRARLLSDTIERIGQACLQQERTRSTDGLGFLPVTVVSYSAVCGACLRERMDLLSLVLLKPRFSDTDGTKMHWFTQFNTLTTFGGLEKRRLIPGNYISQYGGGLLVHDTLAALPFAHLASCADRFQSAFEISEYAIGLSHQVFKNENSRWNVPAGTLVTHFTWNNTEREKNAFLESVTDSGLRFALSDSLLQQGIDAQTTKTADDAYLGMLQKYGNSVF